jgi:hypothetical protein
MSDREPAVFHVTHQALPQELQELLRSRIDAEGTSSLARVAGISEETLIRAAAGLRVLQSTHRSLIGVLSNGGTAHEQVSSNTDAA